MYLLSHSGIFKWKILAQRGSLQKEQVLFSSHSCSKYLGCRPKLNYFFSLLTHQAFPQVFSLTWPYGPGRHVRLSDGFSVRAISKHPVPVVVETSGQRSHSYYWSGMTQFKKKEGPFFSSDC